MRRNRDAKVVATLGPASSDLSTIRRLFEAGVDVFRMNFSHGSADDHRQRFERVRQVEVETGRPIGILADLQGPKLRIATLQGGRAQLREGASFRFDMQDRPGDATRVCLPHPEIFAALQPGADLLLDDGKLRVEVQACGPDFADTVVLAGGVLSDRKGVNVPGVLLPIKALTDKDRRDLDFALGLGADWIALSFVQRPEDVAEARELIGERAGIMVKFEKPLAIDRLDEILALCDSAMVARGDLGVELPPEQVPAIQKRMLRRCRALGKPVIVATQMLESMVTSPVPTRAEASDVATAIYDGADAVMLSAESAAGQHPVEAAAMMDRIIRQVEQDPYWREGLDASHVRAGGSVAEVVCSAASQAVSLLDAAAVVCYTSSGKTSLHVARERPHAPILSLTPNARTARRLALVWGVHSVCVPDVRDVDQMTDRAVAVARAEGFAQAGQLIAAIAGMPFAQGGTTNLLRIVAV
jgi:pyruvate kinase